jgi:hypothetical protein
MVDEQSMESILRTIRELAASQEAIAADQSLTPDPARKKAPDFGERDISLGHNSQVAKQIAASNRS